MQIALVVQIFKRLEGQYSFPEQLNNGCWISHEKINELTFGSTTPSSRIGGDATEVIPVHVKMTRWEIKHAQWEAYLCLQSCPDQIP